MSYDTKTGSCWKTVRRVGARLALAVVGALCCLACTQHPEGASSGQPGLGIETSRIERGNVELETFVNDPVIGPRERSPQFQAVASSPDGFLVVWQEEVVVRVLGLTVPEAVGYVFAARFDASAKPLDSEPILITKGALASSFESLKERPLAVASLGKTWFVAWQTIDERLALARIAADGTLLDSDEITVVDTQHGVGVSPAIACSTANCLVAWLVPPSFESKASYVRAARIDTDGKLLDPAPILLEQFTGSVRLNGPAVASNGLDYLVAWPSNRNYEVHLYGARLQGKDGKVLDPWSGFAISTSASQQYAQALASDGTDYFAVWEENRIQDVYPLHSLYGAKISSNGSVSSNLLIQESTDTDDSSPRIAFDGSNYQLVWRNSSDAVSGWSSPSQVLWTRLDTAGARLEPTNRALSSAEGDPYPAVQFPDVASTGSGQLSTWLGRVEAPTPNLYGASLSSEEPLAPATVLPTGVQTELNHVIATNHDGYLVAWREGDRVRCGRLDAAGDSLDPNGITVASGHIARRILVASNGVDYLVAWTEGGTWETAVYAASLSHDGVLGEKKLIAKTAGHDMGSGESVEAFLSMALVGNAAGYLLTFADQFLSFTDRKLEHTDIVALPLSATGAPRGESILVATNTAAQTGRVGAAASEDKYLVVWEERDPPSYGPPARVMAAEVAASGAIEKPSGTVIGTETGYDISSFQVANTGPDYLVVWGAAHLFPSPAWNVVGVRVGPGATKLDDQPLSFAPAGLKDYSSFGVASDGDRFLVLWADYETDLGRGVSAGLLPSQGGVAQTFDVAPLASYPAPVARLGPQYEWLQPTERHVDVASSDARHFMAVYSQYFDYPIDAYRRVTRLITLPGAAGGAGNEPEGAAGNPASEPEGAAGNPASEPESAVALRRALLGSQASGPGSRSRWSAGSESAAGRGENADEPAGQSSEGGQTGNSAEGEADHHDCSCRTIGAPGTRPSFPIALLALGYLLRRRSSAHQKLFRRLTQ